MSQFLTGHLRKWLYLTAAGTSFVVGAGCSGTSGSRQSAGTAAVRPGGAIVASVRSEPGGFNRLVTNDRTSLVVADLTQARLVRVNRASQEVEPWLAESWTRSDDGLRYTLKLRPNVTFSDGHPFTSDDVAFTFEALFGDKSAAGLASGLDVSGKRLQVTTPDPQTVVVTFPSPFAPGIRILDNVPIYPRHKLQAALKNGTFKNAWSITTPASEIVGLGPFVLSQYAAGQRMVFARNPRYWRQDANGTKLPYLDRITIEFVSEQDAEILRLQSGDIDVMVTEIRPSDYAPLKRQADAGKIKIYDLGGAYDADFLAFNLKPGGVGSEARASWLQNEDLRRAVALAVDRTLFGNTVYFGAAVPVYEPITPANKKWYATDIPPIPYDQARAKQLLASMSLVDRNGDGVLDDAQNQPVRFTLLTQKGHTDRERASAVIRDELKKVGVMVDVVALDFKEVITRVMSGNYEAAYMGFQATDTDPAINSDLWFSSGGFHVWNLGQTTPSTDWEKRIDDLMRRQVASSDEAERKRLFADVQKTFADHLPLVYFAAPRIFVATSTRLLNVTPAPIAPQILWSPDTLAVVH